jgi:hypothetical protein
MEYDKSFYVFMGCSGINELFVLFCGLILSFFKDPYHVERWKRSTRNILRLSESVAILGLS